MFIPLIVLYEGSIWVARFVEPKRRARLSGAPAVTDGDGGGTATGTL